MLRKVRASEILIGSCRTLNHIRNISDVFTAFDGEAEAILHFGLDRK